MDSCKLFRKKSPKVVSFLLCLIQNKNFTIMVVILRTNKEDNENHLNYHHEYLSQEEISALKDFTIFWKGEIVIMYRRLNGKIHIDHMAVNNDGAVTIPNLMEEWYNTWHNGHVAECITIC